jgi:hypothetical protein
MVGVTKMPNYPLTGAIRSFFPCWFFHVMHQINVIKEKSKINKDLSTGTELYRTRIVNRFKPVKHSIETLQILKTMS